MFVARRSELDHVNLVTALHRVAKTRGGARFVGSADFQNLLTSAAAAATTAQHLSNIAWSLATLGVRDTPIMQSISAQAIGIIGTFSAQRLANTAWAVARLLCFDDPLCTAIA
mmetsp:Transcript_43607/g.98976  ORF Transcript_43607/g.98976 Transcript_43607/m.98976 type:complete len:113 (-) Transcript_43607:134-472(-)